MPRLLTGVLRQTHVNVERAEDTLDMEPMSKVGNDMSDSGVAIPIWTSNMYVLNLKCASQVLAALILEQRKTQRKIYPVSSVVELINFFISLEFIVAPGSGPTIGLSRSV